MVKHMDTVCTLIQTLLTTMKKTKINVSYLSHNWPSPTVNFVQNWFSCSTLWRTARLCRWQEVDQGLRAHTCIASVLFLGTICKRQHQQSTYVIHHAKTTLLERSVLHFCAKLAAPFEELSLLWGWLER